MESLARTLLRLHLDDTRRTARPVERSLGSVLQYGETLDVGGIDGGKGSHIGSHPVDDDKRVVAAHDGSGAAHTDRIEHGDAVETVGGDVDTGRLSAQYIEGIVDHTFFQEFRLDNTGRTRQVEGVAVNRIGCAKRLGTKVMGHHQHRPYRIYRQFEVMLHNQSVLA